MRSKETFVSSESVDIAGSSPADPAPEVISARRDHGFPRDVWEAAAGMQTKFHDKFFILTKWGVPRETENLNRISPKFQDNIFTARLRNLEIFQAQISDVSL